MCIYFNKNCVLVTNFKTGVLLHIFKWKAGNANIFRLTFTTEKVHFKQTNILSIKRHQDNKITYQRDQAMYFSRVFCHELQIIYLQNLTF